MTAATRKTDTSQMELACCVPWFYDPCKGGLVKSVQHDQNSARRIYASRIQQKAFETVYEN